MLNRLAAEIKMNIREYNSCQFCLNQESGNIDFLNDCYQDQMKIFENITDLIQLYENISDSKTITEYLPNGYITVMF